MIGHNEFGEAMMPLDIVDEELSQLLRGILICRQSEDNLLGETVNNG